MSTNQHPQSDGPLSGYLVVDLSRALAGPHAGMMLARPGRPGHQGREPRDRGRHPRLGPALRRPRGRPRRVTYFLSCNRNKESIALDLKNDDGRTCCANCSNAPTSLMENFRTGVLDRLGFSAAELHALQPAPGGPVHHRLRPRRPRSGRAATTRSLQGEAGLMSLTGSGPDDPQRVGVPIADLLSGMYGAFGVLAALLRTRRAPAGAGRPHLAAGGASSACTPSRAPGGRWPVRSAEARATTTRRSPLRPVPLPAGPVQISVGSEKLWRGSPRHSGIDADAAGVRDQRGARRATGRKSSRRWSAAFADYEAEPLLAQLDDAGIPAGKVRTLDEVYAWEQVHSQGLVIDVEHKILGTVTPARPAAALLQPPRGTAETTLNPHRAPAAGPGRRSDPQWLGLVPADAAAWPPAGRALSMLTARRSGTWTPPNSSPPCSTRAPTESGTPRWRSRIPTPEYAGRTRGRPGEHRRSTNPSSPAKASSAAGGSPSSSANSASWPAPSASPRRNGS